MTRTFLNVQEGCLFFNLFLESQPHRSQPKGVSLPDSNFFFLHFIVFCLFLGILLDFPLIDSIGEDGATSGLYVTR